MIQGLWGRILVLPVAAIVCSYIYVHGALEVTRKMVYVVPDHVHMHVQDLRQSGTSCSWHGLADVMKIWP